MGITGRSGASRRARMLGAIVLVAVVAALGGFGFVYSGAYNIGADSPHTKLVYWLLETTRDQSVAAHARDVPQAPDLADPARIAAGAGLYAEMCSGCHLAPGMEETEIAQGLYPAAPDFAQGNDLSPQEQFWVIKHGIKASGMAAWGKTHSDTLIWDMVAFLQHEGKLTPEQYQALVKSAPEDHDEMMEHQDADHDHAE
jgi:mono/diheme cytochrome c family protein